MARKNIIFTGPGEVLHNEQPEIIDAFNAAADICGQQKYIRGGGFEYVGHGSFATVYAVPGHPNFVFKVATGNTGSDTPPTFLKSRAIGALPTELWFGDALQRYLKNTGNPNNVHAPHTYALRRFAGGMALLSERIPDAKSMSKIWMDMDCTGLKELYYTKQAKVIDRIQSALAETPLRHAASDLVIKGGTSVRGNNVHLEPPYDEAHSPIWLLDSIGPTILSRARARTTLLADSLLAIPVQESSKAA